MKVTIQIDGKVLSAEQGASVLETALTNGIYIPHLCHHPDLPDIGSCRLCLVEVAGQEGVTPACELKAEDGMVITTHSEAIEHLRKLSMELILAAHPEDCSTCPKFGRCELQTLIQYMGVSSTRMQTRVKGFAKNNANPLYIHDMNRCVLCGRCVRACNDLRGVGVLQYSKQGLETCVSTLHGKLLKDADCRFCGACAEVCPTGTIRDVINFTPAEKKDTLIPCRATCPAHTDVPRYLRLVSQGKFDEANAVLHEKLPFPECLGRVCVHSCEMKCRRGEINEPVAIRNVKRYAAEHADNTLWQKNAKHLPASGKKVCVVGGGPAGMTAAMYLAKQGHAVTIKEANPKPGGQMQYGIPSYRLPREVVDKEITYITDVGVNLQTNCRVDRPLELLKDFDAVLLAVGTTAGVRLPMQGSNLPGVLVNSDFLKNCAMEEPTNMGKHVVILGGGNVAFDCARSAIRLGAESVHLACLETREAMTADEEEIEQAQAEGVMIHPGHTFESIDGTDRVEGVTLGTVKSFSFDESRRPVIVKENGAIMRLACDTVIFAVGQRTDLAQDSGLARGRGNCIATVEGTPNTDVDGIFACGDAVYGTQSVIKAVASGRQAAEVIDRYLGGDGDISEVLVCTDPPDAYIGRVEGFGDLARAEEQFNQAEGFAPISDGLCSAEVCGEAARCLQCDLRFGITEHRLWSDFTADAAIKEGEQA